MKTGYYTNHAGHVLGYWELLEKPVDTQEYIFVESNERPPLYVPPPTTEQLIFEQMAFLASTDYKIIRQNETQEMSDADFSALKLQRQAARDRINQLEQGV